MKENVRNNPVIGFEQSTKCRLWIRWNQRQKALILLLFSIAFLAVTVVLGICFHDAAMVTDFSRKNLAPCVKYPFGTDWLGRNMFYRTLTGLSTSILIGVLHW